MEFNVNDYMNGAVVDNRKSDISVEYVNSITIPKGVKCKTIEQILTKSEVEALKKAAPTIFHKALISTNYEGGFRYSEIRNLQWKDIVFGEKDVIVHVKYKSGTTRKVTLTECVDNLHRWREEYPIEACGDNFVFLNKINQPLSYDDFNSIFKNIAKRAGIMKYLTPQLLRHARIVELVSEGVPERTIKNMFWNDINVKDFDTYHNLSDHGANQGAKSESEMSMV